MSDVLGVRLGRYRWNVSIPDRKESMANEKKLPDGTGGGGRETWARIAEIGLDRAIRENRETWCHIFDYHQAMVLKETDPDQLYANLQSVIDTCHLWQQDLIARKA